MILWIVKCLFFMLKHLVSLISALWVVCNLLIGFSLLIIILLVKLILPIAVVQKGCLRLINTLYRFAVGVNSFWMQKVVGIKLVINGELNQHISPVVICNHQSWFDIPLVQNVITGNGPMIKFLAKQELVWVPIIGWICLALDFPRLQRKRLKGHKSKKTQANNDLTQVQKASLRHAGGVGALLVFPEGTRFTLAKKQQQKAPYKHLLKPRSGGFKMIKQCVSQDTPVVDITIDYHQKDVNIWRCLHGDPRLITITLEHYTFSDIADVNEWLNQRWHEKDQLFKPTAE